MKFHEFRQKVIEIVHEKQNILGIFEEIEKVDVEKVDVIEGDLFLIRINGKKKNFLKIDMLNSGKLDYEKKVLENIPEEIGPFPYLLDNTKSVLPFDYIIMSYVRGKSLQVFFEMHLILFGRKLAELHKVKHDSFGYFGSRKKKLNIWDLFVMENEEFFKSCPALMEDEYLKQYLGFFQKYLMEKQELFDDMSEFSLLHGNLMPQNILFDEYNCQFINWEKAQFGDNARDLVTFFYEDIWFNNRRVKLEAERKNTLIDNYLKAYWADSTFRERVKVWMIYDMFVSLILCRWKFNNYDSHDPSKIMNKGELKQQSEQIALVLKKKLGL